MCCWTLTSCCCAVVAARCSRPPLSVSPAETLPASSREIHSSPLAEGLLQLTLPDKPAPAKQTTTTTKTNAETPFLRDDPRPPALRDGAWCSQSFLSFWRAALGGVAARKQCVCCTRLRNKHTNKQTDNALS